MKSFSQKSFFENPQGLNPFIPQATDLFMSGLHWLNVLAKKEQEIKLQAMTLGKSPVNSYCLSSERVGAIFNQGDEVELS